MYKIFCGSKQWSTIKYIQLQWSIASSFSDDLLCGFPSTAQSGFSTMTVQPRYPTGIYILRLSAFVLFNLTEKVNYKADFKKHEEKGVESGYRQSSYTKNSPEKRNSEMLKFTLRHCIWVTNTTAVVVKYNDSFIWSLHAHKKKKVTDRSLPSPSPPSLGYYIAYSLILHSPSSTLKMKPCFETVIISLGLQHRSILTAQHAICLQYFQDWIKLINRGFENL